jgi:hypothetical protein
MALPVFVLAIERIVFFDGTDLPIKTPTHSRQQACRPTKSQFFHKGSHLIRNIGLFSFPDRRQTVPAVI